MYYTYILRCTDNSLYTGITTDLDRRMDEHFHKTKQCAKYTLHHPAKKLECVWKSENRKLACKLEYHIKQLSKVQKEFLISNPDKLTIVLKNISENSLYEPVKLTYIHF